MSSDALAIVILFLGVDGTIVLLVGIVMTVQGRRDVAAYRRLTRPPVRASDVAIGTYATFAGVVHPSEQGTARSPVTGREGVVFRIAIFERTSGDNRRWVRRHDEQGNTDWA